MKKAKQNFISARLKRKTLTESDVQQIANVTPALKKGSPQMFRNLRDKGGCLKHFSYKI